MEGKGTDESLLYTVDVACLDRTRWLLSWVRLLRSDHAHKNRMMANRIIVTYLALCLCFNGKFSFVETSPAKIAVNIIRIYTSVQMVSILFSIPQDIEHRLADIVAWLE